MDAVTVRTFDNYFNANLMLTKLQDAGIDCYLYDEFTVTIDPLLTNAIGGIKLVVKNADKKTALELLKQFDEDYLKSAMCPRCGENNFRYIAKPGLPEGINKIFKQLFSLDSLTNEYVYQCGNCGYETEKLPEENSGTDS